MMAMKFFSNRVRCDQLRGCYVSLMYQQQGVHQSRRFFVTKRLITKVESAATESTVSDDGHYWPRKIFSGIQPTGDLHLGNYLGAVRKWTKLQDAREDVTYCIVDMHSITVPQDPAALREQIFKMAATMLACGIDPNQSTLFVQSSVKEHSELCWLLGTLSTMARLGHLPQYKEKTRQMKEIPLGLFVYPVLQAADILLYKTTHVPVGEDQVQHIQLTQHLAKNFNTRFGRTFPICHAIIDNKQVSRVRSLRDPTKKMSKSDPDPKSAIYVTDEPEWIVEKVKKSVTDFCSDVSYEPDTRLGVSNLIAIHSQMSGQPIEKIIDEARTLDTGKYKLRVADAIVEHLKPIREKVQKYTDDRSDLITILESGAEKARHIASETIEEVKQKMGLGAPYLPMFMDLKRGTGAVYGGGSGSSSSGGSSSNDTGSVGGGSSGAGLGDGGDMEPVQMPRQNMSAVAKATAAVNAQTGGSTAMPQMSTMIMGFGRPSLTMAFKQVQAVSNQPPMVDHVVEPAPPKPSIIQLPIVPQQKVRVEKKAFARSSSIGGSASLGGISGAAGGKPAKAINVSNITENLLSITLLQRPKALPPQPQSPLQALLPQYQQQLQEHLEQQQQQQQQAGEQQQQKAAEQLVGKARGRGASTMLASNNNNNNTTITDNANNDHSFIATTALTVSKTMPTSLEQPTSKSKKLTHTKLLQQQQPQQALALNDSMPAAVSPTAEVKAAVAAAANAEVNMSPPPAAATHGKDKTKDKNKEAKV